MVALTRIDDQPCVVVGQDRARQTPGHAMGPGALREARRGMRLAEELGLPLVTVIDTPGAELSPDAEERAIAGEIARCIATLTTMTVPTVSVILGQGCGEGRWRSCPPDGDRDRARLALAAAARGRERDRARRRRPRAGDGTRQRVRASDLLADGIVQHVVPEVEGEPARDLAVAVAAEVSALLRGMTGRDTRGPRVLTGSGCVP